MFEILGMQESRSAAPCMHSMRKLRQTWTVALNTTGLADIKIKRLWHQMLDAQRPMWWADEITPDNVRQRERREAGQVRAGHIPLVWPQVRQLRRYPATAVLRILAGVAVAKHAICVCAMSAPSGAFLNKNKTLNMH